MAILNIPPTKSNYLIIKKDLSFATEGFELLEQKREILVLELMRVLEKARTIQKEVYQKLAEAFRVLEKARIQGGGLSMKTDALSVDYEHNVRISSRPLMGMSIPSVEDTYEDFSLQFSLAESTALADETMKSFIEVLKLIGRLAEIENAVWRLAREVKKTQRRVNALEKIFIPNYQETLNYIQYTLEEKERETFFVMKMVKEKLARKKESYKK